MQAPKNKIFYFRLNGKYNSFFTETFNSCLHNSGYDRQFSNPAPGQREET